MKEAKCLTSQRPGSKRGGRERAGMRLPFEGPRDHFLLLLRPPPQVYSNWELNFNGLINELSYWLDHNPYDVILSWNTLRHTQEIVPY
jgi:hypothetical protein